MLEWRQVVSMRNSYDVIEIDNYVIFDSTLQNFHF